MKWHRGRFAGAVFLRSRSRALRWADAFDLSTARRSAAVPLGEVRLIHHLEVAHHVSENRNEAVFAMSACDTLSLVDETGAITSHLVPSSQTALSVSASSRFLRALTADRSLMESAWSDSMATPRRSRNSGCDAREKIALSVSEN